MKRRLPNARSDADSEMARIAETAANWRARCDATLTPSEETDFAAWLAADERHANVFAEMDATWALLDRTAEISPETIRGVPPAAVIALPTRARRRSTRIAWLTTLGVAAAVAVTFFGWRAGRTPPDEFVIAAQVEPGLVKRVNLPDGSVVRLNAESAMHVRFTAAQRQVVLKRGEASFDVANDPLRPFMVTGGGIAVRAVGTAFNVALRAQAVEVLVTEGKVTVDDAAHGGSLLIAPKVSAADEKQSHLAAGEKVTIAVSPQTPARRAAPVTVDAEAIAQALAWQERRLDFDSERLVDIAAKFNRFNEHRLVIADAALGRQRFAGSFRADDPDTFVRLIATRRGVLVERKPGATIIRLAK